MVTIDLATKIIPDSQRIWVVFSGIRRQYYGTFLENSVVFLDYPGLALTRKSVKSIGEIRQHVRMSNAVDAYEREDFNLGPPSSNPNAYSSDTFKDHSSRIKASNVKKMYGLLSVGDLIVVPGGPFDPLLFGEVSEEFDARQYLSVNNKDAIRDVQFRAVKWTRTNAIRSELPIKLQTYLSKPPAISEVSREKDGEKFYPFAYKSFILDDSSYEYIEAPDYSGKNPRETEDANQLISYFIAAFAAIESDRVKEFALLDFDDALDEFYNPKLVYAYAQVFRSPGYFGMLAAAATLAGFVAAGTTLAVSNISIDSIKNGIRLENSESNNSQSPETKEIQQRLNYLMKSLNEDKLKKLKRKGRRAKQNLGLRTKSVRQ